MRKILLLTIAVLTALVSCKKDDTIYNVVTMGNIAGERSIVSDQGITLNITETLYEVDLSSYKYGRVIISCDLLQKTAESQYDIRLTGISSVVAKPVVHMSDIMDGGDETVENPINIHELWYEGGYINMLIEFVRKNSSKTTHLISFIFDDSVSEEGKYTFILRHNAFGEVPSEDDRDYSRAFGYVSFPISDIIEEDEAEITIKWLSHKNSNYTLLETEERSTVANWKRVGFEHKTNSLKMISGYNIR